MAIITTQELKDYLGLTSADDARLTDIVNATTAYVTQYTNRLFGETKQITETHDYAPVIFLDKGDIQTISSVSVNGKDVNLDDLKIDKTTGRIRITVYGDSKYGRNYFDAISVVYTYGLVNVPADLKLAVLQMAGDNYNRNDTAEGNIARESVGGYSKSYGRAQVVSSGSSVSIGNPTDYMAVLNFYRRVRL